jgi:hypothetical protein
VVEAALAWRGSSEASECAAIAGSDWWAIVSLNSSTSVALSSSVNRSNGISASDLTVGHAFRGHNLTLAMSKTAKPWSLTSLREKLIKIGAKVVSHGRHVTFQMAEVAVPRQMFVDILMLIARLRAPPVPA